MNINKKSHVYESTFLATNIVAKRDATISGHWIQVGVENFRLFRKLETNQSTVNNERRHMPLHLHLRRNASDFEVYIVVQIPRSVSDSS